MILKEDCVREIKERLRHAAENGAFQNRELILFGCMPYARTVRDALEENGASLRGIIDNNPKKQGIICAGVNVYRPESFLYPFNPQILVIICSRYAKEMAGQLKRMGYSEKNNVFDISDAVMKKNPRKDTAAEFLEDAAEVQCGYRRYKKILEKYGEDTLVVMRSTPAAGDVYLSCMFLSEYMAKNHIKQYVFLLVSEGSKKVAELFGVTGVEIVEETDVQLILKAWTFLGSKKMRVKPLFFTGGRTKKWLRYENYPQITFMDMYRREIFNLDEKIPGSRPMFDRSSDAARLFFKKHRLKLGKTVILSPYTGSFTSGVPMRMWERLAEKLHRRGYCVCTNCASEKEKPVKNTVSIFFQYGETADVLKAAGYFVALRSGLCDIASTADCKMIVLYEQGFNLSLGYDFFSLRKMGLNERAIELIYLDNDQELLEKILNHFAETE